MAQPFVGQIIAVGFNFAPDGWLLCDGSNQPIGRYQTLYQLIGTTYGGDGVNTFGLPDLRGRAPISMGQGPGLSPYVIGQFVGTEAVTLQAGQVGSHNHLLQFSSQSATDIAPTAGIAVGAGNQPLLKGFYAAAVATVPLRQGSMSANGGSQPHENRQPFQAANYIIAYDGIYPSQQ